MVQAQQQNSMGVANSLLCHKLVLSSGSSLRGGYKALLPGLTQTLSAAYTTAISTENICFEYYLLLVEEAVVGLDLAFQ